jgi:hypothetical protein
VEDRIIFPVCDAPSRSDRDYSTFEENNQISLSPFSGIAPLFSCFPPEYMHLICLGVTRKLCHYYFKASKGERLPCRLSSSQMHLLSDDITDIRTSIPCEFQRKLRPLNEFEHYKASEFRSIILYFGPFLFKKYIPLAYYRHFTLLHFATYVFCSERYTHLYPQASQCLKIFVKQMCRLFGQKSQIYNVHVLLHVPYFVSLYGKLDNFSTFPFENFLSLLKKRIKATKERERHIVSQLLSIRAIYTGSICKEGEILFSNKLPNNCAVLQDDSVLFMIEELQNGSVCGKRLVFIKDLYDYPYPSSILKIGFYRLSATYVSNALPVLKCICIPIERDDYLVYPYA